MSGPRYRAGPPEDRRLASIEGLTLIFHRVSGITHILSAPVPEILDALEEGPADAGAIVARLAARHDLVDDDGAAVAIVGARLAELEAAGLVERL